MKDDEDDEGDDEDDEDNTCNITITIGENGMKILILNRRLNL